MLGGKRTRNRLNETILPEPRNLLETDRAYIPSQHRTLKVSGRHYMNHSIHSADRSTHLKIVVVALVAGIAVAAFGISARTGADYSQTAQVVKAGKPVVVTSSNTSTVRETISISSIGIKTAALGRPFSLQRIVKRLLPSH